MSGFNVEVKPFDHVLYHVTNYWPWYTSIWIALGQWSYYTHGGIVLRGSYEGDTETRDLVMDITASGVHIRPLASDVINGSNMMIMRAPASHVYTKEHIAKLARFAWENQELTGYSIPGLLSQLWYLIVGIGSSEDPPYVPSRFICTQMSSYVDRVCGEHDPCPRRRDAVTRPVDLVRRSDLEIVTERLTLAKTLSSCYRPPRSRRLLLAQ